MPEVDNKKVTNYRDELLSKARSKYPDRSFDDQDGQDGQNLERAIFEMLNESEGQLSEINARNDEMLRLFTDNPDAAEFVNEWARTGDPRSALISTFGDDLSDLATEEGRGKFKDSLSAWREKKAENERMNAEADANWDQSLADLEQWGNEHGLDVKQKIQVLMRLVTVTANGVMNKYGPADFDMAVKEMSFDSAVSDARHEGEVAGRNARIKEQRRTRNSTLANPPSITGGQGMRVAEQKPVQPKSVWSGLE